MTYQNEATDRIIIEGEIARHRGNPSFHTYVYNVGGYGYTKFESSNRVYSVEGISPTIITRYDKDPITGFKILV